MKSDLAKEILASFDLPLDYLERVFDDLDTMAKYKYDYYEMFTPGTRFLEHLISWLRQFSSEERKCALEFIRHNLIFISQREMQDLARFLYFNLIVPKILQIIIRNENLHQFDYGKAFKKYFQIYLRHCLFIGLSDGAKIDFFRRHNIDLSQEQVLPYYKTSHKESLKKLRIATKDEKDNFWAVFLIDDFTGSGYTLIHKKEKQKGKNIVEGSLKRVYEYHRQIIDQARNIFLCHYVATAHSNEHVTKLISYLPQYDKKLEILTGLELSPDVQILPNVPLKPIQEKVLRMCEGYYKEEYETANTLKGGGIKYGYGQQGLPIILYSNTPNNSLFLLWYSEGSGKKDQEFTPLFRRLDRHRNK